MAEEDEILEDVLQFIANRKKGATVRDINIRLFHNNDYRTLNVVLEELMNEGYLFQSNEKYNITERGLQIIGKGKQSIQNDMEPDTSTDKKKLFISYSSNNYDKVKHINKFLLDHPLFEPLIVADKRKANKALTELVKNGIEASYCIIPILSPESITTQWINQEIGYAEGVKTPIKPIVENSVLKELKGFVHSQNQCPYTYSWRMLPYKASENKSFMACFKLLISDLEEEYRKNVNNPKIEGTSKKSGYQKWTLK
jgi:predicted transcriptional regulator